jgi:hypothetical protein
MNSAQSVTEGATNTHVIRFSHKYIKLMDGRGEAIRKATLLQVLPVELGTLSPQFIDYDTDNGKYKLPFKGMYLLLIFQKPNCDLFTTIRSMHSYQKWRGEQVNKLPYYQNLVGKVFDIIITTEKEAHHG